MRYAEKVMKDLPYQKKMREFWVSKFKGSKLRKVSVYCLKKMVARWQDTPTTSPYSGGKSKGFLLCLSVDHSR